MLPIFDDSTEEERKAIETLQSVEGWPADHTADMKMLRMLGDLYPKVNVYEEAVGYWSYMSEFQSKKKVNHRAKFRNWCKRVAGGTPKVSSYRPPETRGHGSDVEARRNW